MAEVEDNFNVSIVGETTSEEMAEAILADLREQNIKGGNDGTGPCGMSFSPDQVRKAILNHLRK